jgi:hypothetical protein
MQLLYVLDMHSKSCSWLAMHYELHAAAILLYDTEHLLSVACLLACRIECNCPFSMLAM